MSKKILIVALAVASFCAAAALAQTVTGQNWVGYVKLPAPPPGDLELIGVNFEGVGTEDGGIPLNEFFNTDNLVGGFRSAMRDKVILWDQNAQSYVSYTYNEGNFYNVDDVIDNPVVFAGDALWLRSAPDADPERDLYALGQVDLNPNAAVNLPEGLRLVSYPYPADLVFDDIDWLAEGASTGFRPAMRDKIYVFVDNGYVSYSLEEDGVWRDGDGVGGLVVETGGAFWYLARAGYTADFARPFETE